MYYGEEVGLTFSFGISGGSFTKEELADYGSINAYYEYWNATSDIMTKIPSRPCIPADFGLDGNNK